MSNEIAIPITVKELIVIRSEIVKSWKELGKAIENVDKNFRKIDAGGKSHFHFDFPDEITFNTKRYPFLIKEQTEALDYALWKFVLYYVDVIKTMTDGARVKYLESLKESKLEFNESNLAALFLNFKDIYNKTYIDTVKEVYNRLIGCSYYGTDVTKRDNLQKIEKCFRMSGTKLYYGSYKISMNFSEGGFDFNDLLIACKLIEGKVLEDSEKVWPRIHNVPKNQYWIDLEYFTVQAYRNGNVKVTWDPEKMDVLDKLNAIGSGDGDALPDSMRKRYKKEHFSANVRKAEEIFVNGEWFTPRMNKDFAFYPTNDEIAQRMVDIAEIKLGDKILEPSAGLGNLIKPLDPYHHKNVTLVEYNYHRGNQLKQDFPNCNIFYNDFLRVDFENEKFDVVLMNPPFQKGCEIYHYIKAFNLLNPGGRLVGIAPEGWFTKGDSKSVIFREWLERNEFKPSVKLDKVFERTSIITRIFSVRRKV